MPIESRRTFRLALTVTVALVLAYGSGMSVPYFAPLLAFILTVKPAPPMPVGKLLILAVALAVILGIGLWVAPLVEQYAPVGLSLVALGLFVSSRLSLGGDKAAVGTLLAMGLTLISALGVVSLALAQTLVMMLVAAVVIAVVSQWIVYPFFPESDLNPEVLPAAQDSAEGVSEDTSALRAVVVIMPAYLFLLINPTGHTPVMMKSIMLAQSPSVIEARQAAMELLGATVLGGFLAVLLWFGLKLSPRLDIFALLILWVMIGLGRKLYVSNSTRFSQQFWIDVSVTMFILIGPAVADSAAGKDPYQAFLFRFGMFFLVAVYTWGSMVLLNRLGWLSKPHQELPA
ncbi:DUF2955 domain-containing protein [Luminiphilus sp.]|nr:DUF2955 domain-containing protein [Luminiphilus sp.]MDB2352700.1 DUF2955 domain-containing protein [Luminiphilus sp.]